MAGSDEHREASSGSRPGSTDSDLIRELKARSSNGWQRFSRQFGPLVYAWCRRSGLQPADAADVMQTVFQGVLSGICRFEKTEPSHSFRAWLRTITKNEINLHYRRSERQKRLKEGTAASMDLLALADPHQTAPGTVEDRLDRLREALRKLQSEFSERGWAVFELLVLKQLPSKTVAETLQMTPAAVRMAKSRMLQRLREILGQEID